MEKTLYERLGGAQTISDIIEKTYDRVLADPLIGKHFDNTDIISLMGAFKCFFARVAGLILRLLCPKLRSFRPIFGKLTRTWGLRTMSSRSFGSACWSPCRI